MRIAATPLATALAFAAATALHAQVRDTTILPSVVVTATGLDSTSSSGFASTTRINGEDLRARGITSVGEALRYVPGVTIVQSGSPGSETALFLRGGERDFTLVLLDGVPLNEPGGFINLAHLSTENVDRIEIVRGPTSVLYGSEAVTGVVQIFTSSPARGRTSDAALTLGSNGLRNSEASVGASGRAGSYGVTAASYRTDGIYDLNNRHTSDSYSGSLRFSPGPRTQASVNARYIDGRYRYPTTFYGEPLDSNSYNAERRLAAGAEINSVISPNSDYRLNAFYSQQKSIFADPADANTPYPYDTRVQSSRSGVGGRVNLKSLPDAVVTLGADYQLQRTETEGGESPEDNPLLERWNRAAFAQVVATSAQHVDLVAGARIDDNERFGKFFTWRAAVAFPLDSDTRLRGAVGTGFREPQFAELSGGGFAKPNPEIEPERTRSWEVAVDAHLPLSRSFVSIVYYRQTFRDLIQYSPLDGDPDYFNQYQNRDLGRANGWELEVRGAMADNLLLTTTWNMLKTRVVADDGSRSQLLRRPSRFGSASMRWGAARALSIITDFVYTGSRSDTRFQSDFSSERVRLGGYGVVNLAAAVAPAAAQGAPPVSLLLRVENLFNRGYEPVAGFESNGRLFSVGGRVRVRY